MRRGMAAWWCLAVLLVAASAAAWEADALKGNWEPVIEFTGESEPAATARGGEASDHEANGVGTTWAVLVAGSSGYENYRHQADVCHAYQILRNGGLKDENIVVFMYDDIANNSHNPRPGVIINNPKAKNVYVDVPKDYTGHDVTAKNFFAVLLGNKTAVTGGSKKVVDSKPNDHIFIYYSDHGGAGVLGMPNLPNVYAGDFIKVLKEKHASNTYAKMVIYVESCESGSIFEGLMPTDINIYITTASNAYESSWGTYCPRTEPAPPSDYHTCIGDLYSVAWMEDSETHNRKEDTINQQYHVVKNRTYNLFRGSHVMEYGDKTFKNEKLYLYQGFNPKNASTTNMLFGQAPKGAINQRDADLLFLWKRYELLHDTSTEKLNVLREFTEIVTHRKHLDNSVDHIGKILFGSENGYSVLTAVRPSGQPVVDDWDCLKRTVRIFESHCGSLTQYGMKHMRAFANICNNGIPGSRMKEASMEACGSRIAARWSPLIQGYSA